MNTLMKFGRTASLATAVALALSACGASEDGGGLGLEAEPNQDVNDF